MNKIKEVRLEAGLIQEQMTTMLGITCRTV